MKIVNLDLDYRADYQLLPKFLQVLREKNIQGRFALIGKFIEQYPEECKLIPKDGHFIINHTYSHPENFAKLPPWKQKAEILACDFLIKNTINYQNEIGFREPHFINSPTEDRIMNLYDFLKKLNYYDANFLSYQEEEVWKEDFEVKQLFVPYECNPWQVLYGEVDIDTKTYDEKVSIITKILVKIRRSCGVY